jgi:acyl dehydratase
MTNNEPRDTGTRFDAGGRAVTGRWFEELTVGTVIPHAIRRTITEADNVGFTTSSRV